MATSKPTNTKTQENLEEEYQQQLQLSLPNDLCFGVPIYLYEGFWYETMRLKGIMAFQNTFQAHDTDIILASFPKSGTTWLKAILYTISNRKTIFKDFSQHPFHTKNPHDLINNLEFRDYTRISDYLSQVPSPRLFGTHVPYQSLPSSIKTSKCRIVYICRNPLDTFVSSWLFYLRFDRNKGGIVPNSLEMMEEHLSKFCKGVFPFGPYEDHLLGYWKESIQNPQKVLFLEYEGLKKDPKMHLKKLAKFVSCPFSDEEEKGNVIDDIIELCSFENLKEMEVNKVGRSNGLFEISAFFRKGEVGDWTNYLTPLMAKHVDDTILQKLKEVDFAFTYYQANYELELQLNEGKSALVKLAPLEAVLFDVDGTLCDSDPLHHLAFREMLLEIGFNGGVPIDEEFFIKNIAGKHNDDIARALFPDDFERGLKFTDEKEAYFRRLVAEQLKPVDGLMKLVKWVKDHGLKRAAVTNAPRANAELMISMLGLTEFFQAIIVGSECEHAKPHPDPYLKGLEAVGATKEHTFIFEDSPSGIRAGVAAGMPVIGLSTRNPENLLMEANPVFLIKDYEDPKLWAALEELEKQGGVKTKTDAV